MRQRRSDGFRKLKFVEMSKNPFKTRNNLCEMRSLVRITMPACLHHMAQLTRAVRRDRRPQSLSDHSNRNLDAVHAEIGNTTSNEFPQDHTK